MYRWKSKEANDTVHQSLPESFMYKQKYGIRLSLMRDFFSFPLLLGEFVILSAIFHWVVLLAGISGLASFLIYCFPFAVLIAHTTASDGESFPRALLRVTFWGYSFIISVAAIAWMLGVASGFESG